MKEKKIISIKAKLIGSVMPVVVVMVGVLVLVAYRLSSNIIREDAKNMLQSSVENQTVQIESWLDENLASFQMAKTTVETLKPDDKELQTMLDSYYGYNDNYPEGFYVASQDGKMLKASASGKQETNPTESIWYQEGLTRINMAVGTAYQNTQGENVISASGILNDGSDKIRVISVDMSLDRISVIVNSFIEMESAEAFLVDKDSEVILANRDSALISQKLGESGQSDFYKQVAQKVAEKNYDFCTLDNNMTVFQEVDGTNWILVSFVPTNVIFAKLVNLRNVMILISAVSILVLCLTMERMIHIVVKPVKKVTRVVTAMADGDFTVSLHSKGNDEIAVMSRSVENFIVSMKSMLGEMGNVSQKLKEQADASKSVSEEMYSAADIQSKSMNELNVTVDQLSVSVNEIAQNATQLAGVAADTKNDSDIVEDKMKETVAVSEQGKKDMERVVTALESIEVSIHNLEEAVNKVGDASSQIVQIINMIGDIAEETNLLSLNASIEAARAGEAGKGFAVVAAQIGKLANDSADSVGSITELITKINELVGDAVQRAGSSSVDISHSAELIHTAIDTFDKIFQNVQDTSTLIGNVADKINEVDQVAANVAAISEEQAASSDEILATSETMLKQAQNISDSSELVETEADNLAQLADQLAQQVSQFKV